MMREAALDSGGLLVALAQVIALFHNDTPTNAVLAQFSSLGVNGKLGRRRYRLPAGSRRWSPQPAAHAGPR